MALFVKWLLLVISALLYGIAFILPDNCACFIFIWSIPLFYSLFYFSLGFKEGLIWGILFWLLHSIAILWAILEYSTINIYIGGMAWFFLVVYASLYSSGIFWIASQISAIIPVYSQVWRLLIWILLLWLYSIIIDYCFLWIFGFLEGYSLAHMLVPLMVYPSMHVLILRVGKQSMVGILLGAQATIAYIVYMRAWSLSSILILSIGCLYGALWYLHTSNREQAQTPIWLSHIGCARITGKKRLYIWDAAHEIKRVIIQLISKYPAVRCIFMPESTVAFALNQYSDVLEYWQEYILKQDYMVILGGQRAQHNDLYNCFYILTHRGVAHWYDKVHGVFFVERVPWWAQQVFLWTGMKRFIVPFTQSLVARPVFHTTHCGFLIPYLCSDLFFSEPVCNTPEGTIVCLVNDMWFSCTYQRVLMMLTARLKALLWHKGVLYISYYYALYITPSGSCYTIPV